MVVSDLSDLGRKGGFRRRGHHRGRGGYGYGYPAYYGPAYYYEELEDKYVLIDPSGKPVTVVRGVPQSLPPGFTFRRATAAEAATNRVISTPPPDVSGIF